MQTEIYIKNYLQLISNGKIIITHKQARELINIILVSKKNTPFVKLFKWDNLTLNWVFLYTCKTNNEKIKSEILKGLENGPIYNFYKWEMYNELLEFQGNIFTSNTNTF